MNLSTEYQQKHYSPTLYDIALYVCIVRYDMRIESYSTQAAMRPSTIHTHTHTRANPFNRKIEEKLTQINEAIKSYILLEYYFWLLYGLFLLGAFCAVPCAMLPLLTFWGCLNIYFFFVCFQSNLATHNGN